MLSRLAKSTVEHAEVPDTDRTTWLMNAEDSVQFLTRSCEANEEILLYASVPNFYVHSVLVPQTAVQPPNHDDLARAHLQLDDTWAIEQAYGGGEGPRIYLDPPLSPCRMQYAG